MCPVDGCAHTCSNDVDKYEHLHLHLVRDFFCPHCKALFSGYNELDNHLLDSANAPCKRVADEYHYWDHKEIFSMFFLGALESYDIPSNIFKDLASERARGAVYVDPKASKGRDIKFNHSVKRDKHASMFVLPFQKFTRRKN